MTEFLLLVAGLLGGCVNTLAGGGSFIVFPALMVAGVPPVLANASNTYAALPGYVSGAAGLWKHLGAHKARLLPYSIVAIVGGYAGAELLLHVSNEQFQGVVPWLMLFAVVLFALGARINGWIAAHSRGHGRLAVVGAVALLGALALICLYGGFFNAGLGILLLAFLALAGLEDIHAMNALKLWISSIVAAIAVVRFAINGSIDWYHGTIALIGVTTGAYLAARFAHKVPTKLIRWTVIIYGSGLTLYYFWAAYFG
ncbi:Predicted permease [Devosia sp. DBB001]|nr:Predicted permease [Devosia sp. DBB001]